ncbi:YicC/YloC family endoribonuclease [Bergeyella sp. RCAD1439]|uniref:YicC/YloC family endoribonuclease n=1 Tax=Bergeyella anatis TaxID=3113737 RepID=UPI002E19F201|nr:YicC/YloC family endoribonuclease [Bergeyella sp. RCAD1439]
MVLSMTGFGRAEGVYEGKKITVDLKSLNSKSFDLNTRIPLRYKEKEFDIRKRLNEGLLRGKVDCFVNCETLGDCSEVRINGELVRAYIRELKAIAQDAPEYEYLKMAVKMPEVISSRPDELSEDEWLFLEGLIREAMDRLKVFRQTEGKALEEELVRNVERIRAALKQVALYEEERIVAIKERYQTVLKDFETVDETRFYQEMAYYTEKLDVSEEKVRLEQHLNYYLEVLGEDFNGKKLGFIAQEMGREINTLGSKANHAEIQKLVVMMKDDLEKIKEQTLNVL